MGFKMKPSAFKSGAVHGTSAYRKASALKKETTKEGGHDKQEVDAWTPPPTADLPEELKGLTPDTGLLEALENYGAEKKEEGETSKGGGAVEKKPSSKKEEKAYGGTKTWSEGMEASGGKLNEWSKKAKTLDKGSAEYAEVQNKINEALGSKVRHSAPEVSAGTEEGGVGSESTDSTKGRNVARDYDPETGTSTKTVTRDGEPKKEVVRTGQETQNRGDDTMSRTRYTNDGGKVVTEKDALNRTRTRYDVDGNVISGGETKERGVRGLADRAARRFSKEGREAAQEKRRQERVDKGPTIIQARKQAAKQRAEEAEEARRVEEGVGPAEEITPIDVTENVVPEKELITKTDETPKEEGMSEEDRIFAEEGGGDPSYTGTNTAFDEAERREIEAEEQADLEATDAAADEEQLQESLAAGEEIVDEESLEETEAAANEEALADQAGDVPGAAMEDIQAKFEETGRPPIYDDWTEAWENMNPGEPAPDRKTFQKMFPAKMMDEATVVAEGGYQTPTQLEPSLIPTAENELKVPLEGRSEAETLNQKQQQVKQDKTFANFRDLANELETAQGRGQARKVNKIKQQMMEARQAYIDAGGDPSKVDMRNLA